MRAILPSRPIGLLACLAVLVGCSDSRLVEQQPTPIQEEETLSRPGGVASHRQMVNALRDVVNRTEEENFWLSGGEARYKRRRLEALPAGAPSEIRWRHHLELGLAEIRIGHELEAIEQLSFAYDLLPELVGKIEPIWIETTIFELGMAHMRRGETLNCATRHVAESCILPVRGAGVHLDTSGSRAAIERFTELLSITEPGTTMHIKAMWLLNIAHMTVGEYPDGVPERFLVPADVFGAGQEFPHFENAAPRLGLGSFNLYGAAVVDDFDGDDYLDLLTTTFDIDDTVHFFVNRGDGTFVDRAEEANLKELYGGINAVQADYDNDGDLDIYVLRGAWLTGNGRHPNSLIRNNGDGTFTDVTFAAGLGNEHFPTQTGAWADYDNDGDVDLYVGNELSDSIHAPCQLFRNNGDGTFTDVAALAGVENLRYTKGVVWGDYDGDRDPDLYTSTMGGPNRLYRNNGDGTFNDVAPVLGVDRPYGSFPVWFWDVDNDGALDLFVSAYLGDKDAVAAVAASYLGYSLDMEMPHLYIGDGNGGFEERAAAYGLDRLSLPMGSNYGDLDNDGWLDFYLGTGYPDFEALMPNVMYRSVEGQRFVDVTYQGGFGHLQKGHSVAFADIDNDGDQDIFEQMGGIFPGDRFADALFLNPGFGNHWLAVHLVGVESNRAALGARIEAVVDDGGVERSIYRWVSSGGSFGSNPLRQTIGLGAATRVERLEVYWPTSDRKQVFENLEVDRYVRVVEGQDELQWLSL